MKRTNCMPRGWLPHVKYGGVAPLGYTKAALKQALSRRSGRKK